MIFTFAFVVRYETNWYEANAHYDIIAGSKVNNTFGHFEILPSLYPSHYSIIDLGGYMILILLSNMIFFFDFIVFIGEDIDRSILMIQNAYILISIDQLIKCWMMKRTADGSTMCNCWQAKMPIVWLKMWCTLHWPHTIYFNKLFK